MGKNNDDRCVVCGLIRYNHMWGILSPKEPHDFRESEVNLGGQDGS